MNGDKSEKRAEDNITRVTFVTNMLCIDMKTWKLYNFILDKFSLKIDACLNFSRYSFHFEVDIFAPDKIFINFGSKDSSLIIDFFLVISKDFRLKIS